MKPPRSITINGKRWKLEWSALPKKDDAWAMTYWNKHRIQIDPRCDDELLIAAIADELAHAHFGKLLDNDAIDSYSDDVAHLITKLGYKRDED